MNGSNIVVTNQNPDTGQVEFGMMWVIVDDVVKAMYTINLPSSSE